MQSHRRVGSRWTPPGSVRHLDIRVHSADEAALPGYGGQSIRLVLEHRASDRWSFD